MGITATFTLMNPDEYSRVLEDHNNPTVKHEPPVWFTVGSSWPFFNEVFATYGEPLSKVFEGDYLPDGFFGLYGGQCHAGYISPALALAITQALVGVEPEHVFARAASVGLRPGEEVLAFYRDFYYEMKVGFRMAERCGSGLSVCIG